MSCDLTPSAPDSWLLTAGGLWPRPMRWLWHQVDGGKWTGHINQCIKSADTMTLCWISSVSFGWTVLVKCYESQWKLECLPWTLLQFNMSGVVIATTVWQCCLRKQTDKQWKWWWTCCSVCGFLSRAKRENKRIYERQDEKMWNCGICGCSHQTQTHL